MIKYYAARAKEYERIYAKPERQEDLQHLRAFLRRAVSGLCVLELACGTGYWTEVIAPAAKPVLATDINEEVLALARSKPIDPQKVAFRQADSYRLPHFSERFTGGLAAFWWSHIPRSRLREFLEQFHGKLAAGARVVFVDNVYVEGSSTPLSRTDAFGNTYQLRKLEDGSTHEVLKNFPSRDELLAAMDGLAVEAQVLCFQYYWILSYAVR
jgi:SAM-dependent methyltransferase